MMLDLAVALAIGLVIGVRSRIWRSRACFLSTPPTRETAIVPFLRDFVCRTMRVGALQLIAAESVHEGSRNPRPFWHTFGGGISFAERLAHQSIQMPPIARGSHEGTLRMFT